MALIAALLLTLARPALSAGDETDYLPDNLGWNGLSELEALAHGHQLQLEVLGELDWSRLPPGSALLVLYPLVELDAGQVVTFLRGGGRLLLADDFGRGEPLLRELGIQRHDGGSIRTDRYHDGNPNLPVAAAVPHRHGLNTGVAEVVTNHPAYFRSRFPTLLGFGDGTQQLLVAGSAGNGRFVALADPSVLINAMLRFSDNETLANNLLGYLRPPDASTRLYVLTRHFKVRGIPAGSPERGSGGGGLTRFLTDYSKFLGRANDFAAEGSLFRALAVVAGGLVLIGLVLVVPFPRRDLRGHWLRPASSNIWAGVQIDLTNIGLRPGSAGIAAAVLREEIDELLTEALDAPGPIFSIHPRWVEQQVHLRGGAAAARLCAQLLSSMKNLSPLAATQLTAPVSVKRGDLALMYARCQRLLKLLGREPLPDVSSAAQDSSLREDHAHHR